MNIITHFRRWLYKMNIIKGLKKEQIIDIPDVMYANIDRWNKLYEGYYPEWHDYRAPSIDRPNAKKQGHSLRFQKLAAEEMAALVYNEKCSISTSDEEFTEFLNSEVFEASAFNREFQRFLEYSFALGGMVIKPYYADGRIEVSFVNADAFVPTRWNNKGVQDGIFINEVSKGDKVYTHLESHYWQGDEYHVHHELYERDSKAPAADLGTKVPLRVLYPDLDELYIFNGLSRSQFVYIKPNIANNIDKTSPLGISIFHNAEPSLQALDEAFNSFRREFKLGKKRILVDQTAINTVVDRKTGELKRFFDSEDEIYEAFDFGTREDSTSLPIKDISPSLRVEEHISAINLHLNLAGTFMGFSEGTFAFDGVSVKTATEIVSENARTFRTKKSHEVIIEEGLKDLIVVIAELARIFEIYDAPEDYDVKVTFNDSVVQDDDAVIERQSKLVLNGLTSKLRAIQEIHGVTAEEAQDILSEIVSEAVKGSEDFDEMLKYISMGGTTE